MQRILWTATLAALIGAGSAEAANFVVTNGNDSGAGSLRAAITAANGSTGPHTISFTFSGTISPLSALPTLTQPTTIQPPTIGAVTLDGSSAGGVSGLTLGADGCVVRSLVIKSFGVNGIVVGSNGNTIGGSGALRNQVSLNAGNGILVTGNGNTITGNSVGTDSSGTADNGNAGSGIIIRNAASNIISSNIVNGNDGGGITITGAAAVGNTVQSNFVGLRFDGATTIGNNGYGVTVTGAGANTIGTGNVIAGNTGGGVLVSGRVGGGSSVLGNTIGTNIAGTAAMANGGHGVEVDNSPNTMVGDFAQSGLANIISGNNGNGVFVHGASASGTKVYGNIIGTNLNGSAAIPNAQRGVAVVSVNDVTIGGVTGRDNTIGGNVQDGIYVFGGTGLVVDTNEIGEAAAVVPNHGAGIYLEATTGAVVDTCLISGNSGHGIIVLGGSGAVIVGNLIGTNLAGTAAQGNLGNGIYLIATTGVTIGQPGTGNGNIISGNGGSGVVMYNASNNVIENSFIGLDVNANKPIPNLSHGVYLETASDNNQIGSSVQPSLQIANNGGSGVAILSGSGNHIRASRIAANGGLGIELVRSGAFPLDGVTFNDAGDIDSGANNLLNAPILTAATTGTANGRLSGAANTQYTVDLFWSTSCDPVGFGEGTTFLSSTTATTNGSGTATFAFTGWSLAPATAYTATASDPGGNTSEFSQCITPNHQPVETLAIFNPAPPRLAALTATLADPLPSNAVTVYDFQAPLGNEQAQWVVGDWDGDGIATPGAYGSGGAFFYTNGAGNWTGIWFGLVNKPAVAGRFDGSVSHDCIGVVDSAPWTAGDTAFSVYYTCDLTSGPTPPKSVVWLGTPIPDSAFGDLGPHQFVAGDFDGDGVDTFATRRGPYIVWGGSLAKYIGAPGTGYGNVVAGDWDGDGITTFGMYYQDGSFFWLNDLQWHTDNFSIQHLGQPIGTPTVPESWRPGGS